MYSSKKAGDIAEKTGDQQLAYLADQEEKARNDINTLIPQATQSRLQGNQRAMDLLGQASPITMGAMQQGNMGAQDVLAGSMPQIQNALMGGNVDYSFMQPRQINADLQGLLSGVPRVYEPPAPPQQSQYNSPMRNANGAMFDQFMGLAGNGFDAGPGARNSFDRYNTQMATNPMMLDNNYRKFR